MCDLKSESRAVVGGQKVWQARAQDHRVSDDNVFIGGADACPRPCDGHEAQCAVELGDIERDGRKSVGADCDRALKKCDQFVGGRWSLKPCSGAGVPPRTDAAEIAFGGINEAAINVAKLDAKLTLAKVVLFWGRWLKTCQVENAGINGCECDIGCFARRNITDFHSDFERLARLGLLKREQLDVKRLLGRVNVCVGKPDGAGGKEAVFGLHRADVRHGDIGACAPSFRDVDGYEVFASVEIDHLRRNQTVGHDLHHCCARGAWDDPQLRDVTCCVVCSIKRKFESVRRTYGASIGVPSCVKRLGCSDIYFTVEFDKQLIATPCDRGADTAAPVC